MPQNPTYSAVYAFGDSLSDAGNVSITTSIGGVTQIAGVTQPVSPPYFQQKYGSISASVFSNGPTWVQDLSVVLGLGTLSPSLAGGTNFANGGAETGTTPQSANDSTTVALSLPAQLTQFKARVQDPSATALYTLSIGSNDILDILSNPSLTAAQQATDVADSVSNEISFVKQLVAGGAKNILVLGVPDLGKTPDVTSGAVNGSNTPSAALVAEASQLSNAYNSALISQLAPIAASATVSLQVINTFDLINNAVANPAAYGLTNVTSPVWSGNFTSNTSGTLAAATPAAQNQFLFWDKLHPTDTGHRALAGLGSIALKGETDLQGSAAQYVVADNSGSLLVQDTAPARDGTQTLLDINQMVFTDGTGIFDSTGAAEDIARLYYTALGRAPDVAGLQAWTAGVDGSTMSLSSVAGALAASPEFIRDYGSLSNAAFVNQLFENALDRPADAAGTQYWGNALASGVSRGAVLTSIAESQESKANSVSTAGDVNNAETYRLYQAVLDRAPDAAGLTYWSSVLAGGGSPAQVAQNFIGSAEFNADFGTLSANDFVSTIYENALKRAADPTGLQFWTTALQGGASQAAVVVGIADGLEGRLQTAGATHANWVFIPT